MGALRGHGVRLARCGLSEGCGPGAGAPGGGERGKEGGKGPLGQFGCKVSRGRWRLGLELSG